MQRSIEQQIPRVATTKLPPPQAKMRNVIFLATCFALVAIALGNNLIIGRRQPGEILVKEEVIVRPRIWGKPQIAICGAVAPEGSEISFVSVAAWNPWVVNIRPAKGGLGTDEVEVLAIGKPNWGFSIRCTIMAVPKKTTSARPTTTPKSTTSKSTTPKSTTSKATTTESTTPEVSTAEPTTPEPTPVQSTDTTADTGMTGEPTETPEVTEPPGCTSTGTPQLQSHQ
ncbi:uncharacterized protein LOC144471172 [Augochlora pura]